MSTIICPQSSLDSSHVIETTTVTLKLSYNQTSFFADWSVLHSPSHKPIDDCFNIETNSHLYNQKSLKLSPKSLELCTESLGSETGSDMSDNGAIYSIPTSSLPVTKSRRDHMESKKVFSPSFPPPLMTMSGPKLFRVRPHREGGRLVIEAIETSLKKNCLQVERSHGRLRLTCLKGEKGGLNMGSHENDMKETEKSEEEMGRNEAIEKFQRLRRCNEDKNGDEGICYNWEPCCWVAIS